MKTKFGRLSIIGEPFRGKDTPTSKAYRTFVNAKCVCGVIRKYRFSHLKSGGIQSCGCFREEQRGKASITHGLANHPLYGVWLNMKNRCLNKNVPAYKNYGGRGISVCKEWLEDFKVFYDWCMSKGWNPNLEIDREDNDGNYTPNNCRITTQLENSRNRRNTLKLVQVEEIRKLYSTGKYTMEKLGQTYGVGFTTISAIIRKQNWK